MDRMQQDMQKYPIEVINLTKDYGHGRGVFDVSFSIAKGEVFGFLGPNGAGKSTTIRHLMGFSKPMSGQTKLFGMDSFENYYKVLGKVGYLPGEIALPEGLTGTEFIALMRDLRKTKSGERLNELLSMFRLDPSLPTKMMSLGDKRKLAIVVAFMNDPDVLILDEPTSGLDPVMQQVFVDLIKQEKQKGKTILLSSHMFNEVEETCDRISIIKDGKIVSTFDTVAITHNENKNYVVTLKNKDDIKKLKKKIEYKPNCKEWNCAPYISYIDENSNKIYVYCNDKDINKLTKILSNFDIKDFVEKKFTLEDYFIQFYKEDKNFGGVFDEKHNKSR